MSPGLLHVSPPFPGFHAPGVNKPTRKTTTRTISYSPSTTSLPSSKLTTIYSSIASRPVAFTKSSSTHSSRGVLVTLSSIVSPTMVPQTSTIKPIISSSSVLVSNYSFSSINGSDISVSSTSLKYSRQSSTVPPADSTILRRTDRVITPRSQPVAKTNKADTRAKAGIYKDALPKFNYTYRIIF